MAAGAPPSSGRMSRDEQNESCYNPKYYEVIKAKTINHACNTVRGKIWRCIEVINEEVAKTDCEVNAIYIGKSFIDKTGKFDEFNPGTWGVDGMNKRRSSHKIKYGTQHFKVVAVVTKDSILKEREDDGTFKHPEEYTVILERRLIESFMHIIKAASETLRLINKSTDIGGTVAEDKPGHVVYMAARTGERLITLQFDVTYAAASTVAAIVASATERQAKANSESVPQKLNFDETKETPSIENESWSIVTVKQNQISITGTVEEVYSKYNEIEKLVSKLVTVRRLPTVLKFNVRKSATKYDQATKRYLTITTGVLDYLMEKYKSKMSITIGEKEWTSLITIRSTGRHTDQMYKCRKELLTELELYDEGEMLRRLFGDLHL